jgi:hypothetical protein
MFLIDLHVFPRLDVGVGEIPFRDFVGGIVEDGANNARWRTSAAVRTARPWTPSNAYNFGP